MRNSRNILGGCSEEIKSAFMHLFLWTREVCYPPARCPISCASNPSSLRDHQHPAMSSMESGDQDPLQIGGQTPGFRPRLTLSAMAGFQTHISKCSERGVELNFLDFFLKWASATKRFARSRIFRYGCLMIILSNRQKERLKGLRGAIIHVPAENRSSLGQLSE